MIPFFLYRSTIYVFYCCQPALTLFFMDALIILLLTQAISLLFTFELNPIKPLHSKLKAYYFSKIILREILGSSHHLN